jgi:hypothetical protein
LPDWALKRQKKSERATKTLHWEDWLASVDDFKAALNKGTFATWFLPVEYLGTLGKVHYLQVPNLAFYKHLKKHHWRLLAETFKNHFPQGHDLQLVPKEA